MGKKIIKLSYTERMKQIREKMKKNEIILKHRLEAQGKEKLSRSSQPPKRKRKRGCGCSRKNTK